MVKVNRLLGKCFEDIRGFIDTRYAGALHAKRIDPPAGATLGVLAGTSYDTFPVNAKEARRRARFFPFGHTPGPMVEPVVQRSPEHPRTLDLRRV